MSDCRMELVYMDPVTYTAISSHELRQSILARLYSMTRDGGSVTKQELADSLGIKYQQLVYQLMNHVRDFWTVVREEKVRGTRMEYIAPINPYAIHFCIGKDRRIFIVDPVAGLYGPLDEVGTRCDMCSVNDAERCVRILIDEGTIHKDLTQPERETLSLNKRSGLRPLDRGFIKALKGMAVGEGCVLTVPLRDV